MAYVTPDSTYLTLLLLVKGKGGGHHGGMNECENVELGVRILPGVDLALWLRLVGLVLFVAVMTGLGIAAV